MAKYHEDAEYHEDAVCCLCGGPLEVSRDAICERCMPVACEPWFVDPRPEPIPAGRPAPAGDAEGMSR